jgi:hypothetical protein
MKYLATLIIAGLIILNPLSAQESDNTEPSIKLRDYREVIMLEDYTIWLLIDDHWIRVFQMEHAPWCGCD